MGLRDCRRNAESEDKVSDYLINYLAIPILFYTVFVAVVLKIVGGIQTRK